MRRLIWTFAFLAPLAIACGGDGDGDADAGEELPNPGFVTPTDITHAFSGGDGQWTDLGPANWDCLGTPSTDAASTVDITLSGQTEDFQSGNALPDALLTAYSDTNFGAAGIATATSDEDGNWTMVLPTGQTRVAFKVVLEGALDTYSLNQYYEPDVDMQTADVNSVSLLTANALPAFIGVTRTIGLGILAGTIRDCDDNEVGGAIATVSETSAAAAHLTGAETYYFSAGSTSLPVRLTQQLVTNSDGLFVVIELPAAPSSFLQVWGYINGQTPGTDELTLLAEISSPVLADSIITADVEPIRQ